MKVINFSKAVATGNDFIIINAEEIPEDNLKKIAIILCRAKYGIGADGLLIAQESKVADLKMRIFNPDGSEAEMCGNGIRCFILWAYSRNLIKNQTQIETLSGIIKGRIKKNNWISIKLSPVSDYQPNLEIKIKDKIIKGDYIDIGVPHFVIKVKDLNKVEVKTLGRFLRFHKKFQPRGTNVDFFQFKDSKLYVRTYERGVEDETLACGTGCIASGLVMGKETPGRTKRFTVIPRSGEELKIRYKIERQLFKDIYLEGKAQILFEGKFYFDLNI